MRFAEFLIRHRWAILVVLAAVTAWAVTLAPRIRFDFTPQAVLEGRDDLVGYAERFKETFGHEDAVLLVVVEATGKADVLDRAALSWQGRAARRIAKLPHIQRVDSIAGLEVPRLVAWLPPLIRTVPLLKTLAVDEAGERRVRDAVDELKLLEGTLVSADRRVAALVVWIDPDRRDADSMRQVVNDVRSALARDRLPPGYAAHLSGLPVLRTDIVDNLQGDLLFLLPLAGVLFLVVLAVLFRSVSGTLLPLLAVGSGLAWTVGLLVATGQSLNIVSNVLPVLLFVIGMANCVHVLNRYGEESVCPGGGRLAVTRRTMAHMLFAVGLTTVTTAIGFASLCATRSEVLQTLGWHASLGMFLLYLSTILILGTLLPSFRPPREANASVAGVHLVARIVGAAGHAVARHPRLTLLCSAAIVIASLVAARNVVVNSYMIETYDEEHPTVQTMRLVENRLSGVLPLEISLAADRPGRLLDPAVYRSVAEAERFAVGQDPVLFARSYVDLHQEVHAKLSGRDGARREMPPDGPKGVERVRLTDAILRQMPGRNGHAAFVSADGMRARILLRVRDVGTRDTLKLIETLEAKLSELFPPGRGITVRLTGDAYVHARGMDSFVRAVLYSLLGASVVIFAVIALLFRSLRLGLISILPNLTPLVVTLGYMGLRGYPMNAANVIVFAISLGIAVDDTIHFLARFREEIAVDADVAEAIRRSYHGTGRAIVLASVLIVAGLSVLLLSEFVPSRRFAELTSVTMLAALVGDLLLLPACLMLFWKRRA